MLVEPIHEFVDFKITDWPDIPLHHEIPLGAFMEAAVIIAGGHYARCTQLQCMARGADCCLLRLVWKE